ncbi:MAG: hypothetical protein V4702_03125 [Patescibacteria group bacterium]
MRKNTFKHSLIAAVVMLTMSSAVPVLAVPQQPAQAQEAQQNAQTRQEAAQTNAEERREAAQTRLADAKLKACQNREKAITNIMARLADRGTKQLDVFTKISERTQEFYTSKGKVLSNYDALVAEVNTKKAAAETAVDTIKNTSVEFACDGEDPKGVVSAFKESLKAEITALKDYKTAVKNLIVGVKSVQGTTSSEGSQQ